MIDAGAMMRAPKKSKPQRRAEVWNWIIVNGYARHVGGVVCTERVRVTGESDRARFPARGEGVVLGFCLFLGFLLWLASDVCSATQLCYWNHTASVRGILGHSRVRVQNGLLGVVKNERKERWASSSW